MDWLNGNFEHAFVRWRNLLEAVQQNGSLLRIFFSEDIYIFKVKKRRKVWAKCGLG